MGTYRCHCINDLHNGSSSTLALAILCIRLSTSPADWGVFGDYFGGYVNLISVLGFIGIIATIKTQSDTISTQLSGIAQEKEIRDDEVYSKQSLECLNEALDKLKSPLDGKLYRSRLAWLESARLIVTAQDLAGRIKSDSMQHTYKAAEKVIRSKFSTMLNPDNSPETMQPVTSTTWIGMLDQGQRRKYTKLQLCNL
ncbi:hypothetical protein CSV86_029545 [Pseudomonas putida CSV86]|uniref:Uncharacterized protein n=1 Tax=Pseudomonas bharatica CSV86 TaxID=1005395 RepID=A0A7K4EMU7_9PSED|nr:hypothetical protein [Pseudomonas bharatica]NNJ18958.1 hypothetical protein [Pseudomonas bharatica CSV86]